MGEAECTGEARFFPPVVGVQDAPGECLDCGNVGTSTVWINTTIKRVAF